MPRSALALVLCGLVLCGCDGGLDRLLSTRPAGAWAGLASQFDSGEVRGTPDSQWTVEVMLGETSRVSYPSLGCSGTLTFVRMIGSGTALYTETITDGQGRCVTSGMVELRRDGDRLHYHYLAQHESQPSVAVGLLTRR